MKKTIRLTESELKNLVREAINELDWKTYANAARKRSEQGKDENAEELASFATERFNDKFAYDEVDNTYDESGLPYHQDVSGCVTPFGTAYVGMGHWTPKHAKMHAGYYPSTDMDSHILNTDSNMKPTKNIIDKYQKASDEVRNFSLDEAITRAIRKYLR